MEQISRAGMPVNTKSLCAFLFKEMARLKDNEITPQEAIAQAALASQITKLFDYELRRTLVEIRLQEIGREANPRIREIESKAFE